MAATVERHTWRIDPDEIVALREPARAAAAGYGEMFDRAIEDRGGGPAEAQLAFASIKAFFSFFDQIGWSEEPTNPVGIDAALHGKQILRALKLIEQQIWSEIDDCLKLENSTIERLVDGADGGQFAWRGDDDGPPRAEGDLLLEQLWYVRRVKGRTEDLDLDLAA